MKARNLVVAILLLPLAGAGCKRAAGLDTQPLDEAGMWFASVQELKGMNITQPEIEQLVRARAAGVSDAGCIELVKLARSRQQQFADGDNIANLRGAGSSEETVLQLARMNQLTSWGGEALAIRLAGMSDDIVLAVAKRRGDGAPVMSGASLARLKGTGLNQAQLLELINRGTTDAQAQQIVAARVKMTTPTGFVHRQRRRR